MLSYFLQSVNPLSPDAALVSIAPSMAFVPAMLLAQRALGAEGTPVGGAVGHGQGERRADALSRQHLEDFLSQFREFYTTCHLLGSGEISSDEALKRTTDMERGLNRLLARVTAATEEKAGLASPGTG